MVSTRGVLSGLLICSIALIFGMLSTGCARDSFEEEAVAKHINTLKRGTISDREWADVFQGKRSFDKYCSGCHGLKGDGNGPAVAMLAVQPRNFTRGMFKFISTPNGSLPCDADLQRTLLRGIPRSSMPSWAMLGEVERTNIIKYVKTFSERWQTEPAQLPLTFKEAPEWVGGFNSIVAGKQVYARMGCANCHGPTGLADGPSVANLTDAEGKKIMPFNFREGVLKGGSTTKDIYRTFYTGLAGTPMPAYGGILSEDENWHLVSYVVYLMGKTKVTEADLMKAAPGSKDTTLTAGK